MKVYMLGNLDGQYSGLVAANNQKEACYLMGVSLSDFRANGGRRLPDGDDFVAIAMSSPGKVFKRSIVGFLVKDHGARWE